MFACRQAYQQRAARGIGQRGEGAVQRSVFKLNHEVKCRSLQDGVKVGLLRFREYLQTLGQTTSSVADKKRQIAQPPR